MRRVVNFAGRPGIQAAGRSVSDLLSASPLFVPNSGQQLWVVAPSRAAREGELSAIEVLSHKWGLDPQFSKECYAARTDTGRSGAVQERAEGLVETWNNIYGAQQAEIAAGKSPTRHLISPVGGQGGSHNVVNWLRKNNVTLPTIDGVFLGFSCSASLLVQAMGGVQRIHGPMIGDTATGLTPAPTMKALEDMLFRTPREVTFPKLSPGNEAAAQEGAVVTGEVIGGNLGVLNKGVGSYTPSMNGKIALVEQVGEDHQIQRMFEDALERGLFAGAKAVVIGQISVLSLPQAKKMEDPAAQKLENERAKAAQEKMKTELNNEIKELFAKHLPGVPLVTGLEIGHGFKSGVIPIGAESTLKLGKSPELTCETRCRQTFVERATADDVQRLVGGRSHL